MDKEIIRKVKKSRLLSHKSDSSEDNENCSKCINKGKLESTTPPQTTLPKNLNLNETSSVSQSSSFMCSHEKIQIEFNISSEETCFLNSKHLKNKLDENVTDSINKRTRLNKTSDQINTNPKEPTFLNELLCVDDSLLENIELPFMNIPMTSNEDIKCTETNENNSKSSDIFNSNQEEGENVDPEEQAWDMSISVVEEKDKTVIEGNLPCTNVPSSPGLSEIILNTWVNPTQTPPRSKDEKKSLEDLLKKTLANNAHKKFVHHSTPISLFSSPSSKSSVSGGDSFFGLPNSVRRLIKRFKGITSLYEWQEECLRLPAIANRTNLVYALPTSGGKTLVAEILVLKEILCREKNVLFVLPYVSIAQEKVRAFSPFAVELGFVVEEYAGSKGAYPPQKRRRKRSVYVATIEKALGLVHSLLECQRLEELGLVVVDELHLIGEPKRGANLESMLTKLIYRKGDIQIVGMSATIGNLSDIATFLKADVYTQDFRPVELTEYVKVENELFRVDHSVSNDVPLVFHSELAFQYSQEQRQQDPDQIGALVQQVIPENSCLVFCPSKKNCENVALLVCNVLDRGILGYKCEEKKALFRALLAEGNGTVCPTLRKTLPFGVAYHHSGLTTAERNLLEEAFLAKTVCCICCTSTLAAGVNLPARRVILRSPYIGAQLLTLSRYKQMIGRAGRTGMGEVGESFLMCKPQDAQKVGELLSSSMDLCRSQLMGSGLECLIISAVDLGVALNADNVLALCRCSLLAVQAGPLGVDLPGEVTAAIDRLVHVGAITRSDDNLELSKIGKAAVKANVDMEMAKQLYSDLQTAQLSLVLLSHLHLLFLVTPYTMLDQIRFQQHIFCNVYMDLGQDEAQTARVLGVGEQCIAQLMTGRTIKGNLNQAVHRFYISLILFDLWNGNSLWSVSNKYMLPRGLVHNLVISASAFSSSVVRFCEVLENMWCFKLLLSEMSARLTHCCTAELLPLMELPAVKIGRAKQLYNAGFKTLNILAKTEPKTLVQAVDHMPRRVAHQIIAAAKLMLLAKAESLQEEAEDVLEGLRENPS